ncbi:unnamed protein product [Dovyalis caffra]|uniref:Uncharacterized protein n=1 Tax=Dovyalis caffra TaxID=77055 RepID=A0AAV1SJI0_9ROSI|nr:unnamed protein product [Dovyalis caffra]
MEASTRPSQNERLRSVAQADVPPAAHLACQVTSSSSTYAMPALAELISANVVRFSKEACPTRRAVDVVVVGNQAQASMVARLGSSVAKGQRADPIYYRSSCYSLSRVEAISSKANAYAITSRLILVASVRNGSQNVRLVTSTPNSHMRFGKGKAKATGGGALCDIEEGRRWLGSPSAGVASHNGLDYPRENGRGPRHGGY